MDNEYLLRLIEQAILVFPPSENFLEIEIKAGEKVFGAAKKQ